MSPSTAPIPAPRQAAEAPARTGLNIVVVRPGLLFPANSGTNVYSAQMLRQLSSENTVTLIACRFPRDTDEDAAETARCCTNLVTVPMPPESESRLRRWISPGGGCPERNAGRVLARSAAGLCRARRPDVLICDTVFACEALGKLGDIPFILLLHCSEARVQRQKAARTAEFFERLALRLQAWRMRRFEARQCRRALRVIAVSDADRLFFENEYGVARCEAATPGVDTRHYAPSEQPVRANNIVFTGAMDWPANQDAVENFANDILPLIQKEIPNVMFSIVGRNPPPRIQKLGGRPGIHVTGTVNDIRPYNHNAKVYVAPLRAAGGTRLSLLEAMAMGKAIVATPAAAEGLTAEHGRSILLADTPETFARETVSLLRDDVRRKMLELNARSLAERTHGWETASRVFSELCHRAIREARVETPVPL